MVNVAGRSRGCATCRTRKIKCDLGLPECKRCITAGLRCPGPRTGAFFIHAQAQTHISNGSLPSVRFAHMQAQEYQSLMLLPDTRNVQTCRAAAFDQLILAHFVESFGPLQSSFPGIKSSIWLDSLPSYLTTNANPLARNSIRAASMICYSRLAYDAALQKEAFRWYGTALGDLQSNISRCPRRITDTAICSVVMLMHFETWASTFPKSWLQHVKGACRMLEVLGPQACQDGFIHMVFVHMRLQIFVWSMAENWLSIFASQDWLTIPYQIKAKTLFDEAVDNLFAVQRCLAIAQEMISAEGSSNYACARASLTSVVEDSIALLKLWERTYMADGLLDGIVRAPGSAQTSRSLSLPRFANIPVAALASMYYASQIMVLRLQSLATKTSQLSLIEQHTRQILAANDYVTGLAGSSEGFGPIMIVFQVKIASLFGASSSMRATATKILVDNKNIPNGAFIDIADNREGFFHDVAIQARAPGES